MSVTRQFLVSLTSIVYIFSVVTDFLLNIRKSAGWIRKR